MDGLDHLREQSADTFIDKILEEMYGLLVIQIQPELLLKLINRWTTERIQYKYLSCLNRVHTCF